MLIPKERYTSAAFMAREEAGLWPRVWLLAGAAHEAASDGEFFVFELGRESILVVRQSGVVRAFFNVCQHRGNLLCAAERGHSDGFRCPYHHWEYGLDGQCRATPGATVTPLPSLAPLECEVRHGFVWVRMTPGPDSLDDFLAPIADSLRRWRPERWRLASERIVDIQANWKTSVDVSNESYHLPALHPELAQYVDLDGIRVTLHGPHSEMQIPLRGSERHKQQIYVFPNVQLNFSPDDDGMELYRHRPHPSLPERLYFDEQAYGTSERTPERRRFRHGEESLGPVMGRDVDLLPSLQRGMRSRGFVGLRLTDGESAIANMHRAIDGYLT